jgi:hypothetical protein
MDTHAPCDPLYTPCIYLSHLSLSLCSDFDKLAHGPRGTQAKHPVYVYRFHPSDGSLVLLNVHGDPSDVVNPAFSRYHPHLDVWYVRVCVRAFAFVRSLVRVLFFGYFLS